MSTKERTVSYFEQIAHDKASDIAAEIYDAMRDEAQRHTSDAQVSVPGDTAIGDIQKRVFEALITAGTNRSATSEIDNMTQEQRSEWWTETIMCLMLDTKNNGLDEPTTLDLEDVQIVLRDIAEKLGVS